MDDRCRRDLARGRARGRERARMLRIAAVLASTVAALLCAPVALAAPGDLDSSFSGDGLLTTDLGFGGTDQPTAIAIQGDGKIVEAGLNTQYGSATDLTLLRLNPNGSLDTSFGNRGNPTTDFGSAELAFDVAIQPDGKIVVVGSRYSEASNAYDDIVVARYNSDGTLDPTFSGDGKFLDPGRGTANGVAIQPDGRILLAGGDDDALTLTRLTASGVLDTSFSGDGRQATNLSEKDAYANDVQVQSNGRIVAVGVARSSSCCQPADFAIAVYDAGGALDNSFSGDGVDTVDFGDEDRADEAAFGEDGTIVVAGGTGSGNQFGDFALLRY